MYFLVKYKFAYNLMYFIASVRLDLKASYFNFEIFKLYDTFKSEWSFCLQMDQLKILNKFLDSQ